MKFNKSSGQASRLLLVLAIVVLVAVILVFLIMKMTEKPPAPAPKQVSTIQLPVYEKQLGNINFIFQSALDKQTVLKVSDIKNRQYASSNQKDLPVDNLGAKYIEVTVGAQNMGTANTEQNSWNIENIVDSQGRNFVPMTDQSVGPWLPVPDLCGAVLHPAFDPSPCTKIYEVSNQSAGLKIRVETGVNNTSENFSSGKINSFLIDLIVK
jgi:hypothetical protein